MKQKQLLPSPTPASRGGLESILGHFPPITLQVEFHVRFQLVSISLCTQVFRVIAWSLAILLFHYVFSEYWAIFADSHGFQGVVQMSTYSPSFQEVLQLPTMLNSETIKIKYIRRLNECMFF